eukprot:632211-Rhodomonas_salina.2
MRRVTIGYFATALASLCPSTTNARRQHGATASCHVRCADVTAKAVCMCHKSAVRSTVTASLILVREKPVSA